MISLGDAERAQKDISALLCINEGDSRIERLMHRWQKLQDLKVGSTDSLISHRVHNIHHIVSSSRYIEFICHILLDYMCAARLVHDIVVAGLPFIVGERISGPRGPNEDDRRSVCTPISSPRSPPLFSVLPAIHLHTEPMSSLSNDPICLDGPFTC